MSPPRLLESEPVRSRSRDRDPLSEPVFRSISIKSFGVLRGLGYMKDLFVSVFSKRASPIIDGGSF